MTNRAMRTASRRSWRASRLQRGVVFRFDTQIDAIEASRQGRSAASGCTTAERVAADAYVVALGSYSPLLLAPLGIRIPVYPLKGYSITLPLGPSGSAPRRPA